MNKSNLNNSDGVITKETIEEVTKNHQVEVLADIANILRLHSAEMTTTATSGYNF